MTIIIFVFSLTISSFSAMTVSMHDESLCNARVLCARLLCVSCMTSPNGVHVDTITCNRRQMCACVHTCLYHSRSVMRLDEPAVTCHVFVLHKKNRKNENTRTSSDYRKGMSVWWEPSNLFYMYKYFRLILLPPSVVLFSSTF